MRLIVKKKDRRIYFLFYGELDDSASEGIRNMMDDVIDREDYTSIVLDLTNLTFMDSTGIGVFIGRYKRLKESKKAMFIINPNRQVDKILNTTGIYQIIKKIS